MNQFVLGFLNLVAEDARRIKEEAHAEDDEFEPALFMGWPGEEPPTHVNLKAIMDHPTDAIWVVANGMTILDQERPIWAISVADSFLSEDILPDDVVRKLSHRGSLAEARAAGDPAVLESVVLVVCAPGELGILNMVYTSSPDGIVWRDAIGEVFITDWDNPEGDMYDALRALLEGGDIRGWTISARDL